MNQSKQRCAGAQGAAGMVNQRVEQPNLSGSYIRSLVKQLTSSGAHANTGVAPYGNALDSHGGLRGATPNVIASYLGEELRRGTFQAVTDKSCEKESPFVNPDSSHVTAAEDAINNDTIGAVQQKPPQVKKQARRRPQTRRPSQECILNIAEARREIVTALHLHRAGNPGTTASRICTAETASIPPMGKSGQSSSIVKSSEKSSRNYNNNNNNGRAGSISRCNACCNIRGNEAKAITICSHLLCWICLGEWLRSASPIKECPVCAKPLAGKDVIPIAPGVTTQVQPHAQEIAQTSSSPSAPVALQSAPLLVNPLPVPQPAWSITEPSLATLMRPAGAIISPIFQGMSNITQPDINFVQVEPYAVYPSTLFPPTTCYGTEIPMTSTSPLKNIQETDPWHVPADEGEYAEIRSLGDRHGMGWSETVNLAARFKFVEGSTTSELLDANPEARGQEYHKEYDKNNNRNHLQQLPEQPLAEKYEYRHDVPQLFEETLAADPRPQEHAVRADNLLDVLPELPAEGLWPDEAFDYQDWIQDLNKRDYNDILVLDGNQSLAEQSTNSEILSQPNKFGPCQDSSDADTAVQSDPSSEIQDNLRVSSAQVGDKRKIDSYDRLL